MPTQQLVEQQQKQPVLGVTRYERVLSSLLAIVMLLVVVVFWLVASWISTRTEKTKTAPAEVEILEFSGGSDREFQGPFSDNPGGVEYGSPDETLKADSGDEERPDASNADVSSDVTEIMESVSGVVELSGDASFVGTTQTPLPYELGTVNTGKTGKATGTGRPALGYGDGERGFPRHKRWFVRFSDRGTLEEYARQLDFFGIELALLVGRDEIVYVSKIGSDKPVVRRAKSGKGENRLYFTWQGGDRRAVDLQLLQKAGISVETGTVFHFYPREAEMQLARKELAYRNRTINQIRRTYFTVQSAGSGFEFEVTKQVVY